MKNHFRKVIGNKIVSVNGVAKRELTLECGHVVYKKKSEWVPIQCICRGCTWDSKERDYTLIV